jgi:SPOR domain/PilZ domain
MVQDRRLCQRLAPSLSPPVLLDKSKYSLLFDLCEGGLAVGGFVAEDPKRVISLEFDMPDGSGYIQAQGEIVWAADSGHRTGFRFLDLPDNSRRLLKDWILTTSAARMTSIDNEVARPAHGLGTEETQTSSHPFGSKETERDATESSVLLLEPEPRWNLERSFAEQNEKFNSGGTALHLASIVIMAVVISSTMAFLLGYYWRGRQPRPRVTTIAAAARSSEYPAYVPASSTPQMPPQTTTPTVLPLDNSGFVLQVGAMEQEASADALSDALRKKNFSAFVFRRGIHDFYRVAVGPYADKGAVIRIQNDLEQEGYKSILKPWSPE